MASRFLIILWGIVLANLAGAAFAGFMALLTVIFPSERLPSNPYISLGLGMIYGWALLFAPPIILGFVSMWTWRDLNLSRAAIWWWTFVNVFVAVSLCIAILRGGAFYLLFLLPLLIPCTFIGIAMAQSSIRKN
jgi:hypothetical protein